MEMPKIFNMSKSSSSDDKAGSPFTEGSAAQAAGPDVSLEIPSHDEELFKKPEFSSAENSNNSQVNVRSSKNGIEVVAQGKGFYNQMRYKQDDKFLIKSEEDFGEWMKCVDPAFEKKRVEFFKAKKAKK